MKYNWYTVMCGWHKITVCIALRVSHFSQFWYTEYLASRTFVSLQLINIISPLTIMQLMLPVLQCLIELPNETSEFLETHKNGLYFFHPNQKLFLRAKNILTI